MAFVNGGFETIGSGPGKAASWTTTEAAAFQALTWGQGTDDETFQSGWSNAPYYSGWSAVSASSMLFNAHADPDQVEDFVGWDSEPLTLP